MSVYKYSVSFDDAHVSVQLDSNGSISATDLTNGERLRFLGGVPEVLTSEQFCAFTTNSRFERWGGTISLSGRLIGGGGSSSKTVTHSEVVTVIPDKQTPFSYSGFKIKALVEQPKSGGSYGQAEGGVGHTTYKNVFSSSNHSLTPNVTITVSGEDYHIKAITDLQKEIGKAKSIREEHEAKKRGLLERIEQQKEVLRNVDREKSEAKVQLTEAKDMLSALSTRIEELSQSDNLSLRDEGGRVAGLIKLLDLLAKIKLTLDFDVSDVIKEFKNTLAEIRVMSLEREEGDSIIASCVQDVDRWLETADMCQTISAYVLFGSSDAGKSTALNAFFGIPIVYNDDDHCVVAEGHEEVAPIGHAVTQSKTVESKVYQKEGLSIVDCGGVKDSRERQVEFAVAASFASTVSKLKESHFLFCSPEIMIRDERGSNFKSFLLTQFEPNASFDGADTLIITKPPELESGSAKTIYSKDSAVRQIRAYKANLDPTSSLHSTLDYILREDGKNILVLDPTNIDQVKDVVERLRANDVFSKKHQAQGVLSLELRRLILEEATATARFAVDALKKNKAESIELSEKKETRSSLESEIPALESKFTDAESAANNASNEMQKLDQERMALEVPEQTVDVDALEKRVEKLVGATISFVSTGGAFVEQN